MNRFKCPNCKKNQYSANPSENTSCIYCGNPTVKRMQTLDDEDDEERTDENESEK